MADLLGDEAKRAAFGVAAHAAVQGRTWDVLVGQLLEHYERAVALSAQGQGRSRRHRRAV